MKKKIKKTLDDKNLQEIALKCHPDHGQHKYELVDEPKK